jgi:hypothetical protein
MLRLLRLPALFGSEHYVRGVGHALAFAAVLMLGQALLLLVLLREMGAL